MKVGTRGRRLGVWVCIIMYMRARTKNTRRSRINRSWLQIWNMFRKSWNRFGFVYSLKAMKSGFRIYLILPVQFSIEFLMERVGRIDALNISIFWLVFDSKLWIVLYVNSVYSISFNFVLIELSPYSLLVTKKQNLLKYSAERALRFNVNDFCLHTVRACRQVVKAGMRWKLDVDTFERKNKGTKLLHRSSMEL